MNFKNIVHGNVIVITENKNGAIIYTMHNKNGATRIGSRDFDRHIDSGAVVIDNR